MGSAARCSYPLEAASDLSPLVILFSWLLSMGLPCMVTGFQSPVRPSCSSSVDSDDFTPDRLPGAASLCPGFVVGASVCRKPVCGEIHHDVLREAVVQGSAYVGVV